MASVVYVAGARPNFVKIAPILRAAKDGPFRSELVHTGQHYDVQMSTVFFEQLGIPTPDVHLEVGSASHGVQTGRIMASFEEYLLSRSDLPRGIVVVGDVNSTMACALVGAKLRIPVAHVEAGLRSFDRGMPEEINRVVTDSISDLLFVSEPSGVTNLVAEGVARERIHYVGNVMIDTLVANLGEARALGMPARIGVPAHSYAVVTLHRPSNVDDPARLTSVLGLLDQLSRKHSIVFPLHPRTRARLQQSGLLERVTANRAIHLIEPLGYREFIGLVGDCRFVVTDSGGIQEETTYLGIRCITLRGNTERPVTLTQGTNRLVGDNLEAVISAVDSIDASEPARACSIDGWDGAAATRIANILSSTWGPTRS